MRKPRDITKVSFCPKKQAKQPKMGRGREKWLA